MELSVHVFYILRCRLILTPTKNPARNMIRKRGFFAVVQFFAFYFAGIRLNARPGVSQLRVKLFLSSFAQLFSRYKFFHKHFLLAVVFSKTTGFQHTTFADIPQDKKVSHNYFYFALYTILTSKKFSHILITY